MAPFAVARFGEPLRDRRRGEALGEQRVDRGVDAGCRAGRLIPRRGSAAAPPSTTKAISPRTGSASAAATSAADTEHLLLEAASRAPRTRNTRRSGATAARSARLSRTRCGASYQTVVSPSDARNAARRAEAVRGGNPANAKRRRSNPESTAAQTNAAGPGSTSTGTPASRAAATRSEPGSLIPGVPASVTTATTSSRARSRIAAVAVRALCSWYVHTSFAAMACAASSRRATRESSATISEASRSASSARSVTSRRLPSGVGTKTSPMASASPSPTVVRRIELRGHIIDSGIFNRVLGILTDDERAAYVIEEFDSGQTLNEPSYARLRDRSRRSGATSTRCSTSCSARRARSSWTKATSRREAAPADGVLPDDFYATTNYETEVRFEGLWIPVERPEMDCAIVIDDGGAMTVAPSDIKAGDCVVVGHLGVKVNVPQRSRRKAVFEFMASAVSSEKPRHALLGELARELLAVRRSGKRVLLVGGPAIIHTGAGPYLAELIRDGYVTALYAGNALAVHDIESQFFGTSLGVNLDDAFPAEEGHVHHLRSVNRIRAAGGIRQAIERRHAARAA